MSEREYVIPFVGLKLGVHTFEFEISDKFFESVEYSVIHKGNVKVTLSFEKKETMMVGNYHIEGVVVTACNLCDSDVDTIIKGDYRLVYKFDNEPSNDESLRIVYPIEFEIDVRNDIMELITVSLPSRMVHPEGECNEEIVELLKEYIITSDVYPENGADENNDDDENDDIDPRWAALKDLK